MSRRRRPQVYGLPAMLKLYARSRTLDFHRYSEYHMRIIDSGYTCIDVWTSGKYWVKETNYYQQVAEGHSIVERGNEKGWIPENYPQLQKFLDKLFFAAEMEN